MTTIDVTGAGYTEASALLHDGNVWAARHFGHLVDGLAGSGGMAGDSAFADAWSVAYDEAAGEVFAAAAEAVEALGNLGRLAFASLENHTRAERASTFGDVRIAHDPALSTDDWIHVLPLRPPASLGGDPSSLPGWANVILDHVEGFVWPDADLDRLRAAAATWRMTADGLDDVATFPQRAVTALWSERSPEIPAAAAAIGRLGDGVVELAGGCREIATVCDEYAEQVAAQREAILDLVSDLIRDAVLIQVGGFVLGLVSLGAANGGAVAINVAKIAAAAPRFTRILIDLRRYLAEAAQALQGTRLAVAGVGTRLRPMGDVRLLMTAEVGQVGATGRRATSFLRAHEGGPMRAHTIQRHVGKSDDYLRARLAADPKKKFVSTFSDERAAEAAITSVLATRSSALARFLSGSKKGTVLEAPVAGVSGRVMARNGDILEGKSVLVQIARDPAMPDGYRIITAYMKA